MQGVAGSSPAASTNKITTGTRTPKSSAQSKQLTKPHRRGSGSGGGSAECDDARAGDLDLVATGRSRRSHRYPDRLTERVRRRLPRCSRMHLGALISSAASSGAAASVFEPISALGGRHTLCSLVVKSEFLLAEHLSPPAVGPLIKECLCAALQHCAQSRPDRLLSSRRSPHLGEGAVAKDPRPCLVRQVDFEKLGDSPCLALEISQQVRIVYEQDIGQVTIVPPRLWVT